MAFIFEVLECVLELQKGWYLFLLFLPSLWAKLRFDIPIIMLYWRCPLLCTTLAVLEDGLVGWDGKVFLHFLSVGARLRLLLLLHRLPFFIVFEQRVNVLHFNLLPRHLNVRIWLSWCALIVQSRHPHLYEITLFLILAFAFTPVPIWFIAHRLSLRFARDGIV